MLLFFACAAPDLHQDFLRLHEPVYEAYALGPQPDSLHDHLAASFRGPELTDRYLEWWGVLTAMEESGTSVQVLQVEYQQLMDQGEELRVEWTVRARVRHGEHDHERTNRYEALFRLEDHRIVHTRMLDMERLNMGGGGDLKSLEELF